jgi:hypothetical protein
MNRWLVSKKAKLMAVPSSSLSAFAKASANRRQGFGRALKLQMAGLLVLSITGWVMANDFCQEHIRSVQQIYRSIDKQKSYFMELIAGFMEAVDEGTADEDVEDELLCYYNYVRKLFGLSQASSIEDIDKAWVQEEDYPDWKKSILRQFEEGAEKPMLLELTRALADRVMDNLENPKRQTDPSLVLYPYNFLRELLGVPRISSLEEIDRAWFNKAAYDADLAALIEEGHMVPTPAQKKLVDAEIERLKLAMPVIPFIHPGEEGSEVGLLGTKTFISFCKNLDLDTRLSTLYHVLGHLKHNDAATRRAVAAGMKGIGSMRNQKDFIEDVKAIKNYMQLGWEAVPSLQATVLGRHLYSLLDYGNPHSEANMLMEKYGVLWDPPKEEEEKEQLSYSREVDERADLFALRELYKQGRMSAILTLLWNHGMSDFNSRTEPDVIAGTLSHNPSDVERALYTIGFLRAQGIDVPEVLYDWETKGTCTPVEEEHPIEAFLKEKISKSHT